MVLVLAPFGWFCLRLKSCCCGQQGGSRRRQTRRKKVQISQQKQNIHLLFQFQDNNISQEYNVLVVEKWGQDNTKKDGEKWLFKLKHSHL